MTTATLSGILVKCGVIVGPGTDERNIIMLGRISEAATLIAAEHAKQVEARHQPLRRCAELTAERDSWRACAEQLAEKLSEEIDCNSSELDEFERLKGQS